MTTIESVTADILTNEALVNVVVRVVDSDGAEGVGEAWWGVPDHEVPGRSARPIASVVDDLLGPRLIGLPADNIEQRWFELWDRAYRYGDHGILLMGLSGIDLALWDLKGRRLDCPVASLLGGPSIESIPAYASFPPLRKPDLLVSETTRALEAGFGAVKLHELDPALTALLRAEFGPELIIMVDVNGHFDPIEAIAYGHLLAESDVLWFEEPVRPMRDHRALARVGAAIDCDLAAGENEYALDDFQRLLATGAITYLQPEITKLGGLTAARRVSALAELHNVALCPHNFRLGPALYASIQWAFTSPASRWIEVPWVPADIRFSFPTVLPPIVDGRVLPLTGPGLGVLPA